MDRTGSTVNFADAFWAQSRSWPVITAATTGGTWSLGTISADSTGRSAAAWGGFSIQQTPTAINLVWTPIPPFQRWQASHFGANWNEPSVAGPLADPDFDGFNNLLEYALLDGDPNVSNNDLAPVGIRSANDRFALVFDRAPRADLTLNVLASDAPDGPWEPAASSIGGAAFTAAADYEVIETGTRLEVRDRYLPADPAHPCRFMKLQVVWP
jgi:hypothetical protein